MLSPMDFSEAQPLALLHGSPYRLQVHQHETIFIHRVDLSPGLTADRPVNKIEIEVL